MAQARRGRRTPTQSLVLPYDQSRGREATDLYNSSDSTAREWQELLCCDMTAASKEKQWVHTSFGFALLVTVLFVIPLASLAANLFAIPLASLFSILFAVPLLRPF